VRESAFIKLKAELSTLFMNESHTPLTLQSILEECVRLAKQEAKTCVALDRVAQSVKFERPFESGDQWYGLDAQLTRWLSNRESTRVHGCSPRNRRFKKKSAVQLFGDENRKCA
jgi:hypothetical protein